jgi:dolichol-phosphate mannosyltransferase
VLETLDLDAIRCRGFAFQAEVALLCQRHGFRVVEHPILFVDRSQGTSKMSWRIVVEALWRLAFLRLRRPAARRSA